MICSALPFALTVVWLNLLFKSIFGLVCTPPIPIVQCTVSFLHHIDNENVKPHELKVQRIKLIYAVVSMCACYIEAAVSLYVSLPL